LQALKNKPTEDVDESEYSIFTVASDDDVKEDDEELTEIALA